MRDNRQIKSPQDTGIGFAFEQEFKGKFDQFIDWRSPSGQLVSIMRLHRDDMGGRGTVLHRYLECRVIQFLYEDSWHHLTECLNSSDLRGFRAGLARNNELDLCTFQRIVARSRSF
jgi:hypothetical protein